MPLLDSPSAIFCESALSFGAGQGFDFMGYVELVNNAAFGAAFGQDDYGLSNARVWSLYYSNTDNKFGCTVFNHTASSFVTALATTLGAPSLNTKYMLRTKLDNANNLLYIGANNGTMDSVACSFDLEPTAVHFRVGGLANGGLLSASEVWRGYTYGGLLRIGSEFTAAEATAFYNGGVPLTAAQLTATFGRRSRVVNSGGI